MLTANSIKASLTLDAAQVAILAPPPDGSKAYPLEVMVKGALVCASLNPKSVRKAIAAVRSDADGFTVVLQGKQRLANGAIVLEEAGIMAQPKKPREQAAAA